MTAQMRLDPSHQFPRTERLGDVVVAADLETQNAIDLVGAGRQEDDRRARELAGLPNLPAEIEAILPGKHHVENDEIGLPCFEFLQGRPGAVQQIHLESTARKIVFDERSQFRFVLHDRNFF